jgi:hypothetical protein
LFELAAINAPVYFADGFCQSVVGCFKGLSLIMALGLGEVRMKMNEQKNVILRAGGSA